MTPQFHDATPRGILELLSQDTPVYETERIEPEPMTPEWLMDIGSVWQTAQGVGYLSREATQQYVQAKAEADARVNMGLGVLLVAGGVALIDHWTKQGSKRPRLPSRSSKGKSKQRR